MKLKFFQKCHQCHPGEVLTTRQWISPQSLSKVQQRWCGRLRHLICIPTINKSLWLIALKSVKKHCMPTLFPLYSCHSKPSRAALYWTLASIVPRLLNLFGRDSSTYAFLFSFSVSCVCCGLNSTIHETTHSQTMHNSSLLFLLSFYERFTATNDA